MRSPRVARPLALALLVAAMTGIVGAGAAQGAPPTPDPPGSASIATALEVTPAVQEGNDTLDGPEVTIEIELRRSGNARFTVAMAFPLDNQRDRTAFRRLAREFKRGDANLALGLDAFKRASQRANATIDRDMRVTHPDRTTDVENDTGTLRLSFTWSNFARQDGDLYRIGDAFNTTDGTWLRGLAEDQRLVIRPPRGYAIHSAPVGHTNSTMRIEGPTTFKPGFLRASYQPTAPDTTTSPGGDRSGLVLAGVLLLGLTVLALAAYVFSRREPEGTDGKGETTSGAVVKASGPAVETGTDDQGTTGLTQGAAAGAAGEEKEQESEEGVDLELLSDEERVEHLLRQNGGRMKQANIVSETGWSNAKVSQLLSAMAEEERVKKLRIGRENLIALPEEDIGEFES